MNDESSDDRAVLRIDDSWALVDAGVLRLFGPVEEGPIAELEMMPVEVVFSRAYEISMQEGSAGKQRVLGLRALPFCLLGHPARIMVTPVTFLRFADMAEADRQTFRALVTQAEALAVQLRAVIDWDSCLRDGPSASASARPGRSSEGASPRSTRRTVDCRSEPSGVSV